MIVKPKPRVKGISGPSPGGSMLTPKTPRMTKKALQERELERRRAYAQTFFEELNKNVSSIALRRPYAELILSLS